VIYLAGPYSDPDAAVREARFRAACLATAKLVCRGHSAFSPIVHGHPLAEYGVPIGWDFWQPFDLEHLARCDELWVLTLDGWRQSVGVQEEIRLAEQLDLRIRYVPSASKG
jgi:hypothetical protein